MEELAASGSASGNRDQAEIDGLLEHWKQTLELRNDQFTTFDKSILWASGGALALTVANVDKIAGPAGMTGLLILCWMAFAVSISLNIVSYWTSAQDAEVELEKIKDSIEGEKGYDHGNVYRKITFSLNLSALLLFLGGIVLLLLHSYFNLMGATECPAT